MSLETETKTMRLILKWKKALFIAFQSDLWPSYAPIALAQLCFVLFFFFSFFFLSHIFPTCNISQVEARIRDNTITDDSTGQQ